MFVKHTNQSAYLKMSLFGFAGSGKTFTATTIMAGLMDYLDAVEGGRKVAMLDSEGGSAYVGEIMASKGIGFDIARTRTFKDLLAGTKEAIDQGYDGLLIDSVSHYWNELLDSFQKSKNIKRLQIHHWAPIKQEWRQFTDLYLEGQIHIIAAGRGAHDWDMSPGEDGKMDPVKVGTKMRAETEFSFEASILGEMDRVRVGQTGNVFKRTMTILKDRTDVIDGQVFENPTFQDILPHILRLNIGGTHHLLDVDDSSEVIFRTTADGQEKSWSKTRAEKEAAVQEVDGILMMRFPSTSVDDKVGKAAIKKAVFGTYSASAIAELPLEVLQGSIKVVEYLGDWASENPWPEDTKTLPEVLGKLAFDFRNGLVEVEEQRQPKAAVKGLVVGEEIFDVVEKELAGDDDAPDDPDADIFPEDRGVEAARVVEGVAADISSPHHVVGKPAPDTAEALDEYTEAMEALKEACLELGMDSEVALDAIALKEELTRDQLDGEHLRSGRENFLELHRIALAAAQGDK